MDYFTLARTFARHWRPSWPPTLAETLAHPRASAELTELAQRVPTYTRRRTTPPAAHTAPTSAPTGSPRIPRR